MVVATVLAIESLVFIGVHAKYREIPPIIMSAMLGLLMAFVACPNRYANRCGRAYGRMVLVPIASSAGGKGIARLSRSAIAF